MGRKVAKVKAGLVVAISMILVIVILLVATISLSPTTTTAPDFSIQDIDGQWINLSEQRGRVLLLDFMYITCEGCKIVTKNLKNITPSHGNELRIISVDIVLSDLIPALQSYRATEGITWQVARDTDNLYEKYNVDTVPRVVIIDKNGGISWVWFSTATIDEAAQKAEMQSAVTSAIQETSGTVSITQMSIPALMIVAAVGSFFSPCSFPLLPGFMAYYLGIDAQSKEKPSTARAASRGLIAGIGMILVYGIIALIVFPIGWAASQFLGSLGLIVGIILIILGVLTLSNLQYHRLIEPFRKLRQRVFPNKGEMSQETGTAVKMFAYGVGYGAAGFACVAPPFIAAVLNASVNGDVLYGAVVFLIYVIIVLGLMVAITILLTEAGQAAVSKMNRYVNLIKKISGIALIIAGAYLIYFWFVSNA